MFVYSCIWNTFSGQCLKRKEFYQGVAFATFSPNCNYILVSSFNSTIQLWDFVEDKCIKTYVGHKNENYSLISNFFVTNGKVSNGMVLLNYYIITQLLKKLN